MNLSDYIIKPIISEKSFSEAKNSNKYTFLVRRDASKTDVKNAIEKLFNVKVLSVYTSIVKGRKTRFTRRGKQDIDQTYKKARVKLLKDQKIDIFEEKTDDKGKVSRGTRSTLRSDSGQAGSGREGKEQL